MPPIGMLLGGIDFSNLFLSLSLLSEHRPLGSDSLCQLHIGVGAARVGCSQSACFGGLNSPQPRDLVEVSIVATNGVQTVDLYHRRMQGVSAHQPRTLVQEPPTTVEDLYGDGDRERDDPAGLVVSLPSLRPAIQRTVTMENLL